MNKELRVAKDIIKELNDEGSDFIFGDIEIKEGKIKTTVGVFMSDERGYTEKELEIPIEKDDDYNSIKDKFRYWQDRHNTPDSFYNIDNFK